MESFRLCLFWKNLISEWIYKIKYETEIVLEVFCYICHSISYEWLSKSWCDVNFENCRFNVYYNSLFKWPFKNLFTIQTLLLSIYQIFSLVISNSTFINHNIIYYYLKGICEQSYSFEFQIGKQNVCNGQEWTYSSDNKDIRGHKSSCFHNVMLELGKLSRNTCK